MISLSALPQTFRCAASAVLPKVRKIGDRDRMGSALHDHMRDRIAYGISGAVDRIDATALRWDLDEREASIFRARAMSFEWTPPRGALPELPLCLLESGEVVPVEGGRGVYERLPPGALLPGTADVFWAEPVPLFLDPAGRPRCPEGSILWVAELKTGKEVYVDPVEKNWQVLGEMLLVARYTRARRAIPAVVFWRKGPGLWDVPAEPYDAAGLDRIEETIRGRLGFVEAQRALYRAGEPLEYTTGTQCTFCDSATFCSAKVGALKRYLEEPGLLAEGRPLTALQAERLAELEPSFAAFAEQVRAALIAYTAATGRGIPLRNGRAWGPYRQDRVEIDAAIGREVLEGEIGAEHAQIAFSAETSKAAIERAIKAAHRANGIERQGSAAMRRVLGVLRERGGLIDAPRTCFGMHEAPAAETVAAPRQLVGPVLDGIPIDGDRE